MLFTVHNYIGPLRVHTISKIATVLQQNDVYNMTNQTPSSCCLIFQPLLTHTTINTIYILFSWHLVFSHGNRGIERIVVTDLILLLLFSYKFKKLDVYIMYVVFRYEIMRDCWKFEPKDRPCFATLVKVISQQVQLLKHKMPSANLSSASLAYLKVHN